MADRKNGEHEIVDDFGHSFLSQVFIRIPTHSVAKASFKRYYSPVRNDIRDHIWTYLFAAVFGGILIALGQLVLKSFSRSSARIFVTQILQLPVHNSRRHSHRLRVCIHPGDHLLSDPTGIATRVTRE